MFRSRVSPEQVESGSYSASSTRGETTSRPTLPNLRCAQQAPYASSRDPGPNLTPRAASGLQKLLRSFSGHPLRPLVPLSFDEYNLDSFILVDIILL